MVKQGLSVVDTSVVLVAISTAAPGEPAEAGDRRRNVLNCLKRMHLDGARFVVPAPVITELCREGPGDEIADVVLRQFGGVRIEAFDRAAALAAGEILRPAMKTRSPAASRTLLKFDAMIAATAHALEAEYLVTANAPDFVKYLGIIGSTVSVVAADEAVPPGPLFAIRGKSKT